MNAGSFWELCKILHERGGDERWRTRVNEAGGSTARPVHGQIESALNVFGSGYLSCEPLKAHMDISYRIGNSKEKKEGRRRNFHPQRLMN